MRYLTPVMSDFQPSCLYLIWSLCDLIIWSLDPITPDKYVRFTDISCEANDLTIRNWISYIVPSVHDVRTTSDNLTTRKSGGLFQAAVMGSSESCTRHQLVGSNNLEIGLGQSRRGNWMTGRHRTFTRPNDLDNIFKQL